jgi:hypothetical protein
MSCRKATCDSEFDVASLTVLSGVTTLTLLSLYGDGHQGTLKAAIADLQQHNPTLRVCMRIIKRITYLQSVQAWANPRMAGAALVTFFCTAG